MSPTPIPDSIKKIQQIVSSILYYAHIMNPTVIMALSIISKEPTKAIIQTITDMSQSLDYLAIHLGATICYCAFIMILGIHFDASYLSEKNAKYHALGHFYLSWLPIPDKPIHLNGPIFIL